LITGGSAGIGVAFAEHLAEARTDLVLVARGEERLQRTATDLQHRYGVEVETVVADLTDPKQVRIVEDRLQQESSPVDLLVNNVGGHYGATGIAPLIEHQRDDLVSEAWLNALVPMRLTRAAAGVMTLRGYGNIVQVSAGTAFAPAAGSANYAASKAYLNSLSLAVNHELRGTGVRITVICPGFTRTDGPSRLGFSTENVPSIMWNTPERIARTALRATARGRRVIYSAGIVDKVLGRLSYYGPRPIVLRVMGSVMSDREPNRTGLTSSPANVPAKNRQRR
jgi:short-subunit dehydrogenase